MTWKARQVKGEKPETLNRDVAIQAEKVTIHGDVAGRDVIKEALATRPAEAMPKTAGLRRRLRNSYISTL